MMAVTDLDSEFVATAVRIAASAADALDADEESARPRRDRLWSGLIVATASGTTRG